MIKKLTNPRLFLSSLALILFMSDANLSIANTNLPEIQVAISEVVPFGYMENGQLKGHHFEIFKQLEKESGLKFHYVLLPHARLINFSDKENPDLLILFRSTCNNHSDSYEIQNVIYTLTPTIFLKESIDAKKQAIRVGRLIGTCTGLIYKFVKKDMISDLVSMDQAVEMLKMDRLDGVCGLEPVINYSNKKINGIKLVPYKSQQVGTDAVICRKKNLPSDIKKKLEAAAKKIKVPNFTNR